VSEGTIRDALHFVLNNPAGAADEIERLRGLLDELWNHPGDTYVRAVIRRVIGDRITTVQPTRDES
jgi:hypothetical protein